MKRRTFISLMGVMAAAGVLGLTGCSSKDTAASTASSATLNKLDSIQKSGKLVVALEGAWQPWSYHDSSDTLVGYDVEVSRAIAENFEEYCRQNGQFFLKAGCVVAVIGALDALVTLDALLYALLYIFGLAFAFYPLTRWCKQNEGFSWPWPHVQSEKKRIKELRREQQAQENEEKGEK